jgi:hypothetical protein
MSHESLKVSFSSGLFEEHARYIFLSPNLSLLNSICGSFLVVQCKTTRSENHTKESDPRTPVHRISICIATDGTKKAPAHRLILTGNAICPGFIETGMTKAVFDKANTKGDRTGVGRLSPLQRFGIAKEIATVALFLASPAASYVTGQAITVDGGLSSSHPVAMRMVGRASM